MSNQMDSYEPKFIPKPFGLNNTGAICYFNGFLQAIAGCTSFTKAVIKNEELMKRTLTGNAMIKFVKAYTGNQSDIELLSSTVLHALVLDLSVRRPHVHFGGGQESASEALIHLLEMMEPTEGSGSPITNLFLHRFQDKVHCRICKNIVSTTTDLAVNFNLFHIDTMQSKPQNEEEFSKAMRFQSSITEDYHCPVCPCVNCGIAAVDGKCPNCGSKSIAATAIRIYNLTMIPEIIFCMFNVYGVRTSRYFPDQIKFPAVDGGELVYSVVGQVEHSGNIFGGHYWARGLRADGEKNSVFLINDIHVSPSSFTPTPNTYIVVYNFIARHILQSQSSDSILS